MGCSAIIIVADYLLSNFSFPLFDETESLWWFGYLDSRSEEFPSDDAVFVNTGIDKTLVPIIDDFGDTIGNSPITDRKALLNFLDILSDSRYKYIFMDIRFEQNLKTIHDSALFSKIASMPRITIADHRTLGGYSIADSILMAKGALADYRANMFSGFSRYEFLQDGRESMPLRAYHELYGKGIEEAGPLYFSDGRLVNNMLFLPFKAHSGEAAGENGLKRFRYLSADFLGSYDERELRDLVDDRIVVIGDFDNDIHTTYIGEMPGPLLHYYAFRELEKRSHVVSRPYIIILFVTYFFVCYALLGRRDFNAVVLEKLKIKSPMAVLITSLIGWGLLLFFIKVLLYYSFKISFIASIPSFVFSSIKTVKAYLALRKTKQKHMVKDHNL